MIVRWGLDSLSGVLRELGVARPLLITSRRWRDVELPVAKRFDGVRPHAEIDSVRAAAAAAQDADGLVALGGGSAIDTGKAVSAERAVSLVSIPTTYSGAEWTEFFGVRDPATRTKGGGMGARVAGIVYDPELTLDLPREQTGGTALNALAHCAEALYAPGSTPELDEEALAGAAAISRSLPAVLAHGRDREARRELLEGAMHAGSALRAGMGVGHAMAQALGGRYGLAHGTMNAVCLRPRCGSTGRWPRSAIARYGEALGGDAIARTEELAGLAGAKPLREYAVPRGDLPELGGGHCRAAGGERQPAPGAGRRDPEAARERLVTREGGTLARILTTHVGSLPRPQDVVDRSARRTGRAGRPRRVRAVVGAAVAQRVRDQVDAGVDFVSDGEMSKIGYATYIRHRLSGFEVGDVPRATPGRPRRLPELPRPPGAGGRDAPKYLRPICRGPIEYEHREPLERDIANLSARDRGSRSTGAFMNAASPGIIALFQPNEHYATRTSTSTRSPRRCGPSTRRS